MEGKCFWDDRGRNNTKSEEWNEKQLKQEKNDNLSCKKEKARGRQNGGGERNGEIWDLKYQNSKHLEIKLKKYQNNNPIHNQQAKIDKDGERTRVF